ncbi:MAG TPA: GumC family protein [Alphaproteobacteria bacterium]|nr:GumC family protein [Alphaproteobacteria bacterium]
MRTDVADNGTRDILNVLFKHQRKIVATFMLVVGGVALYTFLSTPLYEATASLLIKVGREYVYRPEVGEERPQLQLNREDLVNSELEILTSRDLAAKVIDTIGIDRLYPGLDKPPPLLSLATVRGLIDDAIAWYEGRPLLSRENSKMERAKNIFIASLKVEAIPKSNVVKVQFRHPEPELAAQTVNTLLDSFKAKRLEVFSGPKSSFLDEQVEYYRNQLGEAEQRFESFRQQYGVFSLDQQRSLLLSQRNAIDTELKATQNRVEEARKRLASLVDQQKRISEMVPLGTDSERVPVVDDARSRLLALQLKEQELLSKYRDESQIVKNVREEKKVVEDFLARVQNDRTTRTRSGKNPVYEQLQLEIVRTTAEQNAMLAKQAAIEQQTAQIDQELRTLDLRDKELQQIERDIKQARLNYETYQSRAEEARISEQMDQQKMVNISIIESARMPIRPVLPKKTLNMVLAAVFGAAAGIGLAFLVEYLRSGFLTPESAGRSLGVRVLGTVPYRSA